MTDMIERVTQAIFDKDPESLFTIHQARVYARAAIAAMREPTEAMVDQCVDLGHNRDDAVDAWEDMIDAALECSTKQTEK